MAAGDVAAFDRRLRGGEKRVAPHRDRRRSGMRRLAGEPDHVAFDAERPQHDAGRLAHRFEDRSLLDVELEVRARVDRLERAMRVEHAIERHAVLGEGVHEARALAILQLAHLVHLQAAGGG